MSALWCGLFHIFWHSLEQDWIPHGFADWEEIWVCNKCKRKWVRIK